MPLLDIVKGAAIRVGLSPPTAAAAATDRTTIELVYWANAAARELAQWHDWTALAIAGEITGDGTATDWATPSDFDRMAKRLRVQRQGETAYRLMGPLSADERTEWRASNVLTTNEVFWLRGGKIVISPALPNGQKVFFEYQSKFLASNGGTPKLEMNNDADVSRLDEECVTLGLVWRWLRQKRLDYTQEFEDWRRRAELLAGRDQSMEAIAMGSPSGFDLPDPVTPETIVVP